MNFVIQLRFFQERQRQAEPFGDRVGSADVKSGLFPAGSGAGGAIVERDAAVAADGGGDVPDRIDGQADKRLIVHGEAGLITLPAPRGFAVFAVTGVLQAGGFGDHIEQRQLFHPGKIDPPVRDQVPPARLAGLQQ